MIKPSGGGPSAYMTGEEYGDFAYSDIFIWYITALEYVLSQPHNHIPIWEYVLSPIANVGAQDFCLSAHQSESTTVAVFPCAIMITTASIILVPSGPASLGCHDDFHPTHTALVGSLGGPAGGLTLTGDADVAHVYTLEWKVVVKHIIGGKIIH